MADPSRTSATGTASRQATSLYVYGVVPAPTAADWPGADGIGGPEARVGTIESGDLAALVSALPPDSTPGKREDLDAHRRVLALAVEQGTVIPFRFGMVMPTEDVVRQRLLDRHRPELAELLRRLDGRVQMNVRALYAEDALLRGAIEIDPEIARLSAAVQGRSEIESRPERIALGERVAAAVEARRQQDEQVLLDVLQPVVSDLLVEPGESERVAFNAQLLVRRDRRAALDEAVAELGGALQGYLALRYIGPLPPYSFSQLALEAQDERWDF
ncbi:MAG: hypothetical protein QOJ23_3497 [Actinomycetota bacterium]|jgi:hypothetical protein|nr:hypothetical protein [Actinomycetota bacterium]